MLNLIILILKLKLMHSYRHSARRPEEGPNGSIRGDATDERDPGPVARRAAQQRHRTLTDKEGRNKRESHSKMRTSISNENGGPWDVRCKLMAAVYTSSNSALNGCDIGRASSGGAEHSSAEISVMNHFLRLAFTVPVSTGPKSGAVE